VGHDALALGVQGHGPKSPACYSAFYSLVWWSARHLSIRFPSFRASAKIRGTGMIADAGGRLPARSDWPAAAGAGRKETCDESSQASPAGGFGPRSQAARPRLLPHQGGRVPGAGTEWALLDRPGVHDLIEYESRINDLFSKYEDPVCCTYDVSKFSATVIMDAMRVHPAVIIGGIYQENPFYVPPDEFLRELRERAGQNSAGVG
jgi:hypothetical protein